MDHYTATRHGDWYTGHWWVGCYTWDSEFGPEWAVAPPNPLLDVPMCHYSAIKILNESQLIND